MKRIRSSTVAAVAFAASLLAGLGAANAETKAWAAAKGALPADTQIVVGINIGSIKKTTIYQSMVPAMLAKEKGIKDELADIKAACAIDIENALTDVVLAINPQTEGGVVILGLASPIDQDKAIGCMTKLSQKDNKKLTAKKIGKVVEFTMEGDSDKMYLGWLAKDVVVAGANKDGVDAVLGGKGKLSPDLAKVVAKTNTNSAFWAAAMSKKAMGGTGTPKGGYGALDVAAGIVALEANLIMSSETEATKFKTDVQNQIAAMSSGGTQIPADIQKVMKSVKVSQAGDTVTLALSLTEKEVLTLIGMAMGSM